MQIDFKIPEYNLAPFHNQITRINNKIVKSGLIPATITNNGVTDEPYNDALFSYIRYHKISVTLPKPKINNWHFVGKIKHNETPGAVNIFCSIPGEHIPESYRNSESDCNYCQIKRKRNDTFIVRNEQTGELKQVGSTCLKDFFDGLDISDVLSAFELLDEAENIVKKFKIDTNHFQPEIVRIDLNHFLSINSALIRTCGWISSSACFKSHYTKTSTADSAWSHEYTLKQGMAKDIVEQKDKDLAKESIDWIRNLPPVECQGEYIKNLKVICEQDKISHKERGFAASLIVTFKKLGPRNTPKQSMSKYVGEIGEKFTLKVKILDVKPTKFGQMFKMADACGNLFVCFDSSKIKNFGNINDIIKIQATIKKHDEYGGMKQNIVNKCEVV